MARRKVRFFRGGCYHIYNRGADRQAIFCSDENYRFLLRRIKEHIDEWCATMIAYCLMPNHYHFVMRQDGERPLNGFVQAVFNSYTKAFNKMYDRSGTLFEGPFRAVAITQEDYLIHLCRYVHRNPLDAHLVSRPENWLYSNYLEWIGQRNGTLIDRDLVRNYFPKPETYIEFVMNYEPPEKIDRAVRELLGD